MSKVDKLLELHEQVDELTLEQRLSSDGQVRVTRIGGIEIHLVNKGGFIVLNMYEAKQLRDFLNDAYGDNDE